MDLTIYTDDKKPVELSDLIFIIIDKFQITYIYPCLFINKLWNKCIHKRCYGITVWPPRRLRIKCLQFAMWESDEKMVEFYKFVLG